MLTCIGSHFASRVAASLLTSVGLPELITPDLASYEREALALARDPERLQALRAHLVANRSTAPLFDTPRYTRNYEAALTRMVERREAGLPPEGFAVREEHADHVSRHETVMRAVAQARVDGARIDTGSIDRPQSSRDRRSALYLIARAEVDHL